MLGRDLYSYLEVEDLDNAMAMAAADPVNQRWQEHMAPLMDVGSGVRDGSTVYPEEVFHTDGDTESSTPMQRVATLMVLKEGVQEQYKEAHRNIWPEILEGIARAKIRNYTIFMIGLELFSYFEVEDLEKAMNEIAADPKNLEWQEFMAPLMDVGSGVKDGSTVFLEEVFHHD
jgi:L-rhamnose mutarotase